MPSITDDINNRYLRPKLAALLSQCTGSQQANFDRMYGDVSGMNPEKIPMAIRQCESTIKGNALTGKG